MANGVKKTGPDYILESTAMKAMGGAAKRSSRQSEATAVPRDGGVRGRWVETTRLPASTGVR